MPHYVSVQVRPVVRKVMFAEPVFCFVPVGGINLVYKGGIVYCQRTFPTKLSGAGDVEERHEAA